MHNGIIARLLTNDKALIANDAIKTGRIRMRRAGMVRPRGLLISINL
jgi:hypothetical protein